MAAQVVIHGIEGAEALHLDEADLFHADPESGQLEVFEDSELVAVFARNVWIYAVTAEDPEDFLVAKTNALD